jgi:hypothetical protein
MTCYVVSLKGIHTIFDTGILRKLPNTIANWIVSFVCCSFIAFEQPHKRLDITYFILPRTIETFFNMAVNRKLLGRKAYPKLQNVLLIMLAIGIIAARFNEENQVTESDRITAKEEAGKPETRERSLSEVSTTDCIEMHST